MRMEISCEGCNVADILYYEYFMTEELCKRSMEGFRILFTDRCNSTKMEQKNSTVLRYLF